MAFNANLNRIRIEDMQQGAKVSRIDRLRALIKNENNKDFIDQIYYQIAELYVANKDIDPAPASYRRLDECVDLLLLPDVAGDAVGIESFSSQFTSNSRCILGRTA